MEGGRQTAVLRLSLRESEFGGHHEKAAGK